MIVLNWLNTWQFNLVLHLFFAVTYNQFFKVSIKDNIRDGASTVLLQIICALSFLFLIPFFPFKFSLDYRVYLMLLGALIFYAINDRVQTTARGGLPVSEFMIFLQFSKVFLIIAGVFVFHDPIIISKMIGATLIMLGTFALLFKKGQFIFNKYVFWALAGTLAMSIGMSIDIGLISQFNMPMYLLVSFLIPAILIMIFDRVSFLDLVREIKQAKKRHYFLTGISWCGASFFMYRAFVLGSVSLIAPLSALNVLINVVVAYFFLNERDDIVKKIFVSLLILLGVYATVF